MKLKRHHRKHLVTDLYTIQDEKKEYYYIVYSTGNGKFINEELKTQDGKTVNLDHPRAENLLYNIKNCIKN
jgi:hypothetical protein